MNRRSFPQFAPAILRDQADPARVERVWERLEHDLQRFGPRGVETARGRRRTWAVLAVAAAVSMFGAGVGVGKLAWDKGRAHGEAAPLVTATIEKSQVEVLAAGTQLVTFPLDGGGRLTLSPGATVEVQRAGGALTVALLQGEASIDTTGSRGHGGIAVIAAEARLNTPAGSVVSVRRNSDDLDISVTDGMVSLSSPAGVQELHKGERALAVPIREPLAAGPIHDAAPHRGSVTSNHRSLTPPPSLSKATGQSEWLARVPTDEEGALRLLQKQGIDHAIDTARSATELMAIGDLMRHKGRDQAAAVRAFQRVVDRFPSDQNAFSAANYLAELYQGQGQTELAGKYREKAEFLATATDALYCNLIDLESDKTKAAELAMGYWRRYPNGQCHLRIQEMLQGDDLAPLPVPASPSSSAAPRAP